MDQAETKCLDCSFDRRYGVEIEVNAFDGIARGQNDPPPLGIDYVGSLVSKVTQDSACIKSWHLTHNNGNWVIKPDGSAGIEVCSPILKGWRDLHKTCNLVHAFKEDSKIKADERCSLHIHINVADLKRQQLAAVVAYWIKCEPVFMDSVPPRRKLNRYCQLIGVTDLFTHDFLMDSSQIIANIGRTKYTSLNTYHYTNDSRKTIEFRIMENETCKNPFFVKNWVRLILHFVECSYKLGVPNMYEEGNQWSSLLWLDTIDVLKVLGFDGNTDLSPGLKQVRNWFLGKLKINTLNTGLPGIWSDKSRSIAYQQLNEVLVKIKDNEGIEIGEEHVYPKNLDEALYSKEYIN